MLFHVSRLFFSVSFMENFCITICIHSSVNGYMYGLALITQGALNIFVIVYL